MTSAMAATPCAGVSKLRLPRVAGPGTGRLRPGGAGERPGVGGDVQRVVLSDAISALAERRRVVVLSREPGNQRGGVRRVDGAPSAARMALAHAVACEPLPMPVLGGSTGGVVLTGVGVMGPA